MGDDRSRPLAGRLPQEAGGGGEGHTSRDCVLLHAWEEHALNTTFTVEGGEKWDRALAKSSGRAKRDLRPERSGSGPVCYRTSSRVMASEAKTFGSAAEEARHWKAQVDEMRAALHEAETGLQEFMESSKELEAEMEADMAATSQRADALQTENEHLRADVDEWRTKYQKSLAEHNVMLSELQRELTKLRETHDVYKTRLRDMEVDNDTLENAERYVRDEIKRAVLLTGRMINSSLQDMEMRYHHAMERTALLETELEEKSRLEVENQRLKDELRELREELAVTQQTSPMALSHAAHSSSITSISSAPRPDQGELTLSDLVVKPSSRSSEHDISSSGTAPPDRTAPANTLERLREHMYQLQQRLQRAQISATNTALQRHWQRSSIPRPRSSMSASASGAGGGGQPASPAAWRAPTPSWHERPETPGELRRSMQSSSIPVPVGGLSRSQSRSRPSSRMTHDVQSPVGPVPFQFMEHDPAASPVSSRHSALSRRKSMGAISGIPPPASRARAPSSTRSPSKMPRPVSPARSPTKRTTPIPWR